jgi:hypothetical protein
MTAGTISFGRCEMATFRDKIQCRMAFTFMRKICDRGALPLTVNDVRNPREKLADFPRSVTLGQQVADRVVSLALRRGYRLWCKCSFLESGSRSALQLFETP